MHTFKDKEVQSHKEDNKYDEHRIGNLALFQKLLLEGFFIQDWLYLRIGRIPEITFGKILY
ncbi:MAG: hypothetical protein ACE5J3_07810, partial [Methanosarcinales archaeon]